MAIAAWRELLQARFRLLDRWCAFMTDHYKALVVTEDTWVQVGRSRRRPHNIQHCTRMQLKGIGSGCQASTAVRARLLPCAEAVLCTCSQSCDLSWLLPVHPACRAVLAATRLSSCRPSAKHACVLSPACLQLLEFSRTVHEDLSNYDPTAAWPVVLDEFVEALRHSTKK